MYFWQREVTKLYRIILLWLCLSLATKVIELLSIQCALVALIFGNTKSLSSFILFVYLEIKMDAGGALWPLTSFHLINHVFCRYWGAL
jgi:hypothetical protein